MTSYLIDFAYVMLRWGHAVIGIAWIGHQMMLYALEKHFHPPLKRAENIDEELWMAHGGRFLNLKATRMLPNKEIDNLIWFRWGALFTWLTGISLFVVFVLSWGNQVYINEYEVLNNFPPLLFCMIALFLIWGIYELVWSSAIANTPRLAYFISVCIFSIYFWWLGHIVNGRVLFIIAGGLFGTIMSSNVWLHIVPNMKKMINTIKQGKEPDFSLTKKSKNRAFHIRISHFPVLFCMFSAHFSVFTGSENAPILVVIVVFAAISLRQVVYEGQKANKIFKYALPISVVSIFAVFYVQSLQSNVAAKNDQKLVTNQQAFMIVKKNCSVCHSLTPLFDGQEEAPAGIMFDELDQIHAFSKKIYEQAISSKMMPPGNVTGMTDKERETLGHWLLQYEKSKK